MENQILEKNQPSYMEGIRQFENKMVEERENILKLSNQHQKEENGKYPFYLNSVLAADMESYLHDCRHLVSEKIIKRIPDHKYHRKEFEKVNDWEILEYRYLLEKDIEKGIHALNQVIYDN